MLTSPLHPNPQNPIRNGGKYKRTNVNPKKTHQPGFWDLHESLIEETDCSTENDAIN